MLLGRVILLISLCCFGASRIFSQPSLDEPFLWNQIPLGASIENLNLKYLKTQNYLRVYTHPNEIKNFEGIEILQVRYYFWDNKLHSIVIKTKEDAEQAELLLAWLKIMFGEGTQIGFAPRYHWKGKQTELHYDKNLITHQVEWKILSVPLQQDYEKHYKKL